MMNKVSNQIRKKALLYWNGLVFTLKHLRNRRIRIGPGFQTNCHIHVVGPGRVIIGRRARFLVNALQTVRIQTLSESAVVTIGNFCVLGGTKIICSDKVTIHSRTMIADSLIMDVDFFNDPEPSPISIASNCWIASQAAVLKGSILGQGSVLSLGSGLCGREIGPGMLCMGNPARPILNTDPGGHSDT